MCVLQLKTIVFKVLLLMLLCVILLSPAWGTSSHSGLSSKVPSADVQPDF